MPTSYRISAILAASDGLYSFLEKIQLITTDRSSYAGGRPAARSYTELALKLQTNSPHLPF
jgi:hypothetical protein